MSKFVNKEYLAQSVAEEFDMTKKQAFAIVDLIFRDMSDCLAEDGIVDITAFGKFIIFDRKSRMGINPVTKERMEIPATKLPKFRPSQTLKNKCNLKEDAE